VGLAGSVAEDIVIAGTETAEQGMGLGMGQGDRDRDREAAWSREVRCHRMACFRSALGSRWPAMASSASIKVRPVA